MDFSHLRGKIICFEGLIGAGKTTAVESIQHYLEKNGIETIVYREPLNLDLLRLFLRDPKKYAFAFQLNTLNRRQLNYKLAEFDKKENKCILMDRSLMGDRVFATMHRQKGNINDEEYRIYEQHYKLYLPFQPDYILNLKVTADEAMKRISARDRTGESAYDKDYLLDLKTEYARQFNMYSEQRKKIIKHVDWNNPRILENGRLDDEACLEMIFRLNES